MTGGLLDAGVDGGRTESRTGRVPRLDEEPEIIKFLQCDSLQYEATGSRRSTTPSSARKTLESHLDEAVEAERLGFDGILCVEHHFDGWTPFPSPTSTFAAVACRTSRLRIGQSVSVLPFHNRGGWPKKRDARYLSNGRAEIGWGKGTSPSSGTATA